MTSMSEFLKHHDEFFGDNQPWDLASIDAVRKNQQHLWEDLVPNCCYVFPGGANESSATKSRIYASPLYECLWFQPYVIMPGVKQVKIHMRWRYFDDGTGTIPMNLVAGMGLQSNKDLSTQITVTGGTIWRVSSFTMDCPRVETPTQVFLQLWHQGGLAPAAAYYKDDNPAQARIPWMYRADDTDVDFPANLFHYAVVTLRDSAASKVYANNIPVSRHRIITYEDTQFNSTDLTGTSLDVRRAIGLYPQLPRDVYSAIAYVLCAAIEPKSVIVTEVRDPQFLGAPTTAEIAPGRPPVQNIPRSLRIADKRIYKMPRAIAMGTPSEDLQTVLNRSPAATFLLTRNLYVQKSPAYAGASPDVSTEVHVPIFTHLRGERLDVVGVLKHQGDLDVFDDPNAAKYVIEAEVMRLVAGVYTSFTPAVVATQSILPKAGTWDREATGYDMVSDPRNFYTEGCSTSEVIDRLVVEGGFFSLSLRDFSPGIGVSVPSVPPMESIAVRDPEPLILRLKLSLEGNVMTTARGRVECLTLISSDPPDEVAPPFDLSTYDGFVYSFDAAVNVIESVGVVSTWDDVSNVYTAIPRGTAPTYTESSDINGEPTVNFTTSPSRAMDAGTAPLTELFGAPGITVYTVSRAGALSATTYKTIVSGYDFGTTASRFFYLRRRESDGAFQFGVRTTTGDVAPFAAAGHGNPGNGETAICCARWSGGSGLVATRVNGRVQASSSYTPRTGTLQSTNTVAHLSIGAQLTTTTVGTPYDGPVACVVVFNTHHDDSTVAEIESILARRFDVGLG